ncbi:MAG TPA: dihydroxyacetone kinase subunit DhaL [Bryobacteraceae bacterium]|jgi:dihydroxyacetone kinase|nr:dihydroxyacetone kinase subunit DhaL [Bryobacteraceae bacterium]
MKKLINRPEQVVPEMLDGLAAIYPHTLLLAGHRVLLRRDAEEVRNRQVAVISGGGSGHEPAHAGYVGPGMLSAAVAGEVFTSPNPESVLAAIQAVAGSPGVLLIVKNYTGDRLNFGLAAEMARSQGIAVETVIVADDVALAGAGHYAGARGLAGTVFVHKVAGAAAAEGRALHDVAAIAHATADAVATMGVSLAAGTAPGAGQPSYTLGECEMEIGLGIHGEPGVRRVPLQPADQIADQMIEAILSAQRWSPGERVAVLVNNLGATTPMELAIFARRVLDVLPSRAFVVERVYCGTFMTSLDAAGVSLSLLRVDDTRLAKLDAPATAPAWPAAGNSRPQPIQSRILASGRLKPVPRQDWSCTGAQSRMQSAVEAACRALVDAEHRLTEMDRTVGDGDLGVSLARAAKAIERVLPSYSNFSPAEMLKGIGMTVQWALGGSSGPLYGVFLLRAAKLLESENANDPKSWARAVLEGCGAISNIGGASAGDRTMLDALLPFASTFGAALEQSRPVTEALESAVCAAETGAAATAQMFPRRGRSSYLGERAIGHPDPGAVAVAIWLRAAASAIVRM